MKREALRFAAFGGNHVNIGIAVVGSGEGDPFTIGRKLGIELVARTGGNADCGAALAGSGPEIAGVREDDFIFGDISVTEKARRSGGRLVQGCARSSRLQAG